jgi:nucleotide-binding universal stress UspA family protein
LVQGIVYPGAPGVGWSGGAEIIATAEQEARAYLEKLCQRLRADGVEVVQRVIRSPSPWQLALTEADGDPIVITTRARSPLRRAFLGSVADKVVRGATGPVLVIPPKAAGRSGAGTRSK